MASVSGKKGKGNNKIDICLVLTIIFAVVNAIYWSLYSVNAYKTFHEYSDLGAFAYDMFYHIHYPGIVWGLQYLIFGNHIAPDLLLMLPIYAIFQSALTLLFIQAIVLSVTGVVLFFIARDLLDDRGMALLLAVAYFLNPGMHGMLIFDFHAESLIILFYILTFYFYMKKEMKWMVVSLALLLGAMEVAPFLGLTLGVGLVLYEVLHTKGNATRNKSIRFALVIVIISLAVLISYNLITAHLAKAYVSGYVGLPPSIMVLGINPRELNHLAGILIGTARPVSSILLMRWGYYVVTGLIIVFMGFGIASLLDPATSLVLTSPWLVEIFVLGRIEFVTTWFQYFSFALGGAIVATLLTMKRMMGPRKKRTVFRTLFISSIIVFVLLLTALEPLFIFSANTNSYSQDFLFQVNSTQQAYYSELNYVISKIPSNASLMAPYFVMPHIYERRYLEGIGQYTNNTKIGFTQNITEVWFTPQYILTDLNKNISLNANPEDSGNQSFFDKIRTGEYTLCAKNGTAMLYKLSPGYK